MERSRIMLTLRGTFEMRRCSSAHERLFLLPSFRPFYTSEPSAEANRNERREAARHDLMLRGTVDECDAAAQRGSGVSLILSSCSG
jgi:hypothetical protein